MSKDRGHRARADPGPGGQPAGRDQDTVAVVVRKTLQELAGRILALQEELKRHDHQLGQLVGQANPQLLQTPGRGRG